jgi:hypothetical protein
MSVPLARTLNGIRLNLNLSVRLSVQSRILSLGRQPMARQPTFAPCVFLPFRLRKHVPAGAVVCDVSSYADHPYCTLSPMWPHGGIPVPGMPGTTSDSVEGIWQGLKVIGGKTARRYFSGQGHKRGGKPRGHQFGDKLLKIIEAREKIYRVTYEWMLEHRADPEMIAGYRRPRRGVGPRGRTGAVSQSPPRGHVLTAAR